MGIKEVIAKLRSSRGALSELVVDGEPGVYAFFLKPGASLRCGPVCLDELVYVGMSSDLAARQFDMHFSSDNTGFSTVRRSLGALLKDDLGLRCIPRGHGNGPANFRNYRFEAEGEAKLTEWMHANLQIATCPIPSGYDDMERAIIPQLQPSLCLTHWPNPNSRLIRSLRKLCADEARARTTP